MDHDFASQSLSMVGKAAKRLYLGVWLRQTPHLYSWSFVNDKTPSYSAEGGIADIRHAFETCRYIGKYGSRENVYLLLGFNMEANPTEILYNEIGEDMVNVFHAMPCRNRFLYQFEEGE